MYGEVISTYTTQQAVEDGATVPIFYQSCVAPLHLTDESEATLSSAIEATEGVSEAEQQRPYAHWSQLELILGTETVIEKIAQDVLEHWDKRRETLSGKAMLVTMSCAIAARFYEKIVAPNRMAQRR